MADSLQIRRGKKEGMPALIAGEPAWCTDEQAFYIGDASNGNVCVASAADRTKIETVLTAMPEKLTASAVAEQTALADGADLAAVIAAFNALIEAMKESKVMETTE